METLFADTIEVIAGADHQLAGETAALTDLLAYPWALPPANQRWRHEFDALFTAQGIEPPQPVATSNSASYLKALLRRGGYLSFLPRQTIGDPGEEGLVAIAVDAPAMRPEITLTTRDRALASPPVAELVQVLRRVAGEL